MRALIEAGAGVRKPEIGGRALQLAAQAEHVDVVRTLMEAKAPLGFAAWENEPPVQAAAARGQWSVVESLLEAGLDADQVDRSGQTALMKAAASGHDKAVTSLLRLGAAPDLPDRDGWTALMARGRPPLLGIGGLDPRPRARGRRREPPGRAERKDRALMIAAEKGNELATDELLRSGARRISSPEARPRSTSPWPKATSAAPSSSGGRARNR